MRLRTLFTASVMLSACTGLGGQFMQPPKDGHELASRIATLLHSGRTETRSQAYNYFGIDAHSPPGRIIDPDYPGDEHAGSSLDWSMSYTGKDFSKSMNVLIWKGGSWCIRIPEMESLLRFRFDAPEVAPIPGMATRMRHDGSVEKVSATFGSNGCMTAFWAAVQ